MPNWTNRPPTDTTSAALRIVRVPPKAPITLTILSHEIVGTPTHFANNRTTPCDGPGECDLCARGIGWRWHGYLAVRLDATGETAILELTAQAAARFADHFDAQGTLRAARAKLARANGRPNGRILVAINPPKPDAPPLPDEPDIRRNLCHIWGLAPAQAEDGVRQVYPAKSIHVSSKKPA